MSSTATITRRSLIAGTAALSVAAATPAFAAEPAAEVAWDAEYDVVVLGMGFSGLVSAMSAADEGASVLICEKAPEGSQGGNSKVCGQMFAWAQGDVDAARKYYTALAAGRYIPEDMLEILSEGIAGMGERLSEKYEMDASEFTNKKDTSARFGYMSPEYPEKDGSYAMGLWSTHAGDNDSYLYQYMSERFNTLYADKVDVWFEAPGNRLIRDHETGDVLGVTLACEDGDKNVRALGGVIICTGGFEYNKQMVQDYLDNINTPGFGGAYNEGDGIRMAAGIGAHLWHMAAWEGASYVYDVSSELPNAALVVNGKLTTGGSILVGPGGRRYVNETISRRHGHVDGGNGIWVIPHLPEHIFAVLDQTQMDLVEENGGVGDFAEGIVTACASLEEAAQIIGCETEALQQTVEDFDLYCEEGRDRAFGRNPETMRPFDGTAWYVVPVRYAILNTQGGPERNANCQIVDVFGEPIGHLYGAGECGELTVCMYQGGTNVASCFIFGEIAGKNAAAAK